MTSIFQPCDQGIIKAFKALSYRKAIIKRLVAAIDAGSSEDASEFSKSFYLLDCMNTIVASWSEIHCENHRKLFSPCRFDEDLWDEDDNIPLAQLLAAPRGMDQQTFDDIVSVDNFLETAPPIDENSIIEEQQSIQESDDENGPKPAIISNLADMKDYLCSHGFDDWKSFSSLTNFSTEVCSNVAKTQALIDCYFHQ